MKPFIDIDEGNFRSQLERLVVKQIKKGARAGLSRVMAAAHAAAVPLTPVDKGNLRRSERWRVEGDGFDAVGYLVATASYAKFVHDGTGIHGPLQRPSHYWRKPARRHTVTTYYRFSASIMGVGVSVKRKRKTFFRGSRSGGGAAIEVISMGMKGTPFFELGIMKIGHQMQQIFLQGFFSAID